MQLQKIINSQMKLGFHIKINLDIQSDMKTSLSLMVIDSFGCDKRGLSESQQCFKSKVKRKKIA